MKRGQDVGSRLKMTGMGEKLRARDLNKMSYGFEHCGVKLL